MSLRALAFGALFSAVIWVWIFLISFAVEGAVS